MGQASQRRPDGSAFAQLSNNLQTESVGPTLSGAARVIEGHADGADGKLAINAFAVVSWNTAIKPSEIHTWNGGRMSVCPIVPPAYGDDWETPMGPAKLLYKATFKDGVWRETGRT